MRYRGLAQDEPLADARPNLYVRSPLKGSPRCVFRASLLLTTAQNTILPTPTEVPATSFPLDLNGRSHNGGMTAEVYRWDAEP